MSLPQLTYKRYEQLGGRATEEKFNASLRTAESSVREIIGFNEPIESNLEAYERAVCAAVEVDVAYGGSGGIGENAASFTLSKFSVSAGSSDGRSSYKMDMAQAIRRELIGSGLLYQGIA